MEHRKVTVSWSGGKDSALALDAVLQEGRYEVAALLCTVSETERAVTVHRVPEALVREQARSLGLTLRTVIVPAVGTSETYHQRMRAALEALRSNGIDTVVHGDIFLEDLRSFRERKLAEIGMRGLFPLWGRDTRGLVEGFLARGYRGIVVSVDTRVLDGGFAGRELDLDFLRNLPPGVDPCGERGEYHSFVFDGPIFRRPISFRRTGTRLVDGRYQCCLLETG